MDRHRLVHLAGFAVVAVIVVVGFGLLTSDPADERAASGSATAAPPTGASGTPITTGDLESRSLRTPEGAVAAATTYALALDDVAIFDPTHRAAVLEDIAADANRAALTTGFDDGLGLISSQLHLDVDAVEDPGFVWRAVPGGWQLIEYGRTAASVAVWTAVMAIADDRLLAEPGWRTTQVQLVWEREAWRLVGFETQPGPDPGRPSSNPGSVAHRINAFEPYRHWPATSPGEAGR